MPEAPGPVSAVFTPALVAALSGLRLRARSLASSGHQGRRRSTARGRSLEFADFRHYVHGDDPRDLDWNAVARFDSLLIRLFHSEIALPLVVLVDGSASMDWGKPQTKRAFALQCAAALSLLALSDDTPVTVSLVEQGSDADPVVTMRGRGKFPALLRDLDAWCGRPAPAGNGHLDLALKSSLRRRAGQRVVLLTDGYDAEVLMPGIGALRSAGAEVDMIQVLDPHEVRPPAPGDYAMVDSETGEESRITVDSHAIGVYRGRVRQFLAGWRQQSRKRGAGYAFITTDVDLASTLPEVLFTGGMAIGRTG